MEATNDPPPPPQPHFIDAVSELRNLSASMSTFTRRYDDLQAHLEYIGRAIDLELPQHMSKSCIPEQAIPTSSTKIQVIKEEKAASCIPEQVIPPTTTITPSIKEEKEKAAEPVENSEKNSMEMELEAICKAMYGRELRRYVSTHLSNVSKLHEELPKALKLAKDPAKLVLDSVGRYYLQGRSAYIRDPKINRVREASIIILECLLRIGVDGVVIDPLVKEEAEVAAESWRYRLNNEGGILNANVLDARGLLYLITGFGIPNKFTHEVHRDLIIRCNCKDINDVLRRSSHFISNIPAILDKMLKDKEHIKAVNIAYTFEVESYQLPVLKAYLKEMKDNWTKTKGRSTSPAAVNTANKFWLSSMISVVDCLKEKGLDHSNLLPEWKLNEKISHLKKEVSIFEKDVKDKEREEAAKPKRKMEEVLQPSKKSKSPKVEHVQHGNGHSASLTGNGALRNAVGLSNLGQQSILGLPDQHPNLGQPSILGLPDQHRSREMYPGLLDQQHQLLVERYLVLPDQLCRSPERYPGLPDHLGRSPERYPGLPDHLRRSPERYPGFPYQHRRSSEMFPGLSDQHRRSPERFSYVSDHHRRSPERLHGLSDRHRQSPERLHGLSDRHRRSLERFPGLSDPHRRSPERFPGLSDQHRRSLERHNGFPDEHITRLQEHNRPFETFARVAGEHRSLEGFAGLPDNLRERNSGRNLGSGLYQFADSVLEMESKRRGNDCCTSSANHRQYI